MRLRFVVIGILFSATVGGFSLGAFSSRHFSVENTAALFVAEPESQKVRLVFVGDIMLSRGIGKIAEETGDYALPFASTAEVLRSADIAFANLESPISARGVKSGSVYSFRADPRAVEGLTSAGFDAVSIANNHIWDYGEDAFRDTISILEENGIAPVGGGANYDEAHAPKIFSVGKTKVAFLAYTNLVSAFLGTASSTPAIARFNDDILKNDIMQARKLSDVVVASFHWGEEYETEHSAEQERVAKLAIDSGANLVIGHHPHVVQEVEEYNSGYIAYSLGNFVFDQNFSEDTGRGLVLIVTFRDGKIAEITKRDALFTDDYRPYFAEEATPE